MLLINCINWKAIIDRTPDATTEEKAAKSKVDEEVIKAKHGIDQAKQIMT